MKNLRKINLEDQAKESAIAHCMKIKRVYYAVESKGMRALESPAMQEALLEIVNDSRIKCPEPVRAYPYVCKSCGTIWNKFLGIGICPSLPSDGTTCDSCDAEMYQMAYDQEN